MPNYAFDVVLKGALRLDAPSEKLARKTLKEVLNCVDSNLGAWPNGNPILAELSLHDEYDPYLYEVDGEGPLPSTQVYGGEKLFADGDRFRIFEEPARGWRIARLADGAEAIFQGDDRCEEFRHNFHGDEFGTDDPAEQSAEADEFGDWCVANGDLPTVEVVAPVLSEDSAKAFLLDWMARHQVTIDVLEVKQTTRMGVPCVLIDFIGPDALEDDVTIWQQPDGSLAFDEEPF